MGCLAKGREPETVDLNLLGTSRIATMLRLKASDGGHKKALRIIFMEDKDFS